MLQNELETAIELARTAARRINQFYLLEIISEEKIGVDSFAEPVTEADREASRIIVSGLSAAFPNDAILSEEEPDDAAFRLSRDRVWIIDPIDGTAGFVKKDGDFAVQIGLAVKGTPVLGVVLLPFHKVLYYASKGGGAWIRFEDSEPERIRVSNRTSFSKMKIAVSRNHPSSGIREIIQEFGLKGSIDRGSVGLKVGLITERSCDLYIHLSSRTKLWDTCGPQAILEEAGGRVTDLFGDEFRYDRADLQNHNGIAATNGAVHQKVLSGLRPILTRLSRVKH